MKERGILMSAPMVRALLAGTKTQTRRMVKPQPEKQRPRDATVHTLDDEGETCGIYDRQRGRDIRCLYGRPGDRLWVRETHYFIGETGEVFYRATGDSNKSPPLQWSGKWRSSIHMARRHSRITLEITGVRVERLQEISDEDAIAEGIMKIGTWDYFGEQRPAWWYEPAEVDRCSMQEASTAYLGLWDSINGAGSWEANPWVWIIEFRKIET